MSLSGASIIWRWSFPSFLFSVVNSGGFKKTLTAVRKVYKTYPNGVLSYRCSYFPYELVG